MNELYSVDGQMYSVSPENKEKFLNEFPGAQLFQERSGVEVDMTEPDQAIMQQTEFATDMLDPEDKIVDDKVKENQAAAELIRSINPDFNYNPRADVPSYENRDRKAFGKYTKEEYEKEIVPSLSKPPTIEPISETDFYTGRMSKVELDKKAEKEARQKRIDTGQEQLSASESILNSLGNAVNQLETVDDRAKYLWYFAGTFDFDTEGGKQRSEENRKKLLEIEGDLRKADLKTQPTIGFTDLSERESLLEKGLGGVAAFTNAVTAFGTSMAISAGTGGVGLASEMVSTSVRDYNNNKAKEKGVEIGQLIEEGDAEVFLPATLGAVAYALEKKGISKAQQLINAKTTGAQNFLYSMLNSGRIEGGTEYAQFIIETFNGLLGERAGTQKERQESLAEISKQVVDKMMSKEGFESFLQGFAGGKGVFVGGKILTGATESRSPEVNKQIQQDIQQISNLEDIKHKRSLTDYDAETINRIQEGLKARVSTEVKKGNDTYSAMTEQDKNGIDKSLNNIQDLGRQVVDIVNSKAFTEQEKESFTKPIRRKINKARNDINNIRSQAEKRYKEGLVAENIETIRPTAEKLGVEIQEFTTTQEFTEATGQDANVDGFIQGDKIFINNQRAAEVGAISVGSHELLHRIIDNKLSDKDTKVNLASGLIKVLREEGNLDIVQQRIDANYKLNEDGSEKAFEDYAEEYFTVFSDAIVKGDIKYNESIGSKILEIINTFINQFTPFKQAKFETGKQAYNFVKDYSKNIQKGKVTEQAVDLAGQQTVEIKKSITQIGDQIKALVPEGTTKQQYDTQVIGNVYNDLVIGDRLNGLIRGQLNKFGITGDNVFGKPINNFVEDVKQQLFERSLTRFNPETNNDLGGFVVSELQQFRIGDVVNRYKRETGGGRVGSLDIQPGETGSIKTPIADEASLDIDTAEAPRSELKQGLIIDGKQFVDKKLENEIETNTIEIIEGITPETNDKDFKTFVKDAAQQKSFKSVKGKLKNFDKFLEDNVNILFGSKNLPIATLVAMERRTPAANRIFTGEPTRLTTQAQIDKAIDEGDFYVEKEKQGPSKYPRKKPTIEEVKKFFFDVGASTKGTRKDGLVNAISFSLFRDIVPGVMNRADIVQEDIGKISAKLIVDPTIKFSITKVKENAGKTRFNEKVSGAVTKSRIQDAKDNNYKPGKKYTNAPKKLYDRNKKLSESVRAFEGETVIQGMSRFTNNFLSRFPRYEQFLNKALTFGVDRSPFGVQELWNKNIVKRNSKEQASYKKSNYTKATELKQDFINETKKPGYVEAEFKKLNDLIQFYKDFEIYFKDNQKDIWVLDEIALAASNAQTSPLRSNAPTLIYETMPGTKKPLLNTKGVEEHTQPQNEANSILRGGVVDGNVDKAGDIAKATYMQGFLSLKNNDLLDVDYKSTVPDLMYTAIENNLNLDPGLLSVIRLTEAGVDLNNQYYIPTKQLLSEYFFNDNNIDLKTQKQLIRDLFSGKLTLKQLRDYGSVNSNVSKNKPKVLSKNSNEAVKKYSKSKNNDGLLNDLNDHDKALRNARDLNVTKKGISIFDFDDTLATSKSKVIVEMPDGSTNELTPAQFAKQHGKLEQQGASFDFSQFNKVIDGKPGPLVAKLKKAIDKFGNKDVFVLTARPQASAQAIFDFLKGIGLEVPLQNITGLEDGTPQAKANWVIGKAGEGYNDFYFTDDVYKNVKAVQQALEVVDVKSKTRLAYGDRIKKLDRDFNDIIEAKTGIAAEKEYGKSKAQVVGANKGKFTFFIPPSAEDFVGLLYNTLSKGKLGDSQMAWYKKNLIDPYASAMAAISRERITLMDDYKALKKQLGVVPKNLRKKISGDVYTNEQALRVYIWNKQGMTIPGLSKADLKDLTNYIDSKPELKVFGDQLININKGDGYAEPRSSWLGGTITTDLLQGLGTTKRAKHLQQWQQNVDVIFSEKNLNKLEAANGGAYRNALEGILQRMKTGRNRSFTGDSITGKVTDWLTNSIGTIMFFNTRSALLQTISAVNFVNFTDNNIFKAGKAYANQKQFWSDFMSLMNSEFLVDRRRGLRINVNEADIANMANEGGPRGVVSKLLEFGFLPTQIADSFAIASGGATFYRNRINTYKKQGLDQKAAEQKAFNDFREIAEESQQSSRPDRISQQQAGPLGRIILAFANTPMQYARLIKKAASDLKNRRGDVRTNISKIIYYGVAQNLIFNALQQAIFAIAFGDNEDEEDEKEKYIDIANGMADSLLRGVGIAGAFVSVGKNIINRVIKESQKDNPKYEKISFELARISPPISSKLSRLNQAGRAFQWQKDEMVDKGFAIDNPALLAGANVISAATNVPVDRLVRKANNVNTAVSQDLQTWERLALLGGWQDWELGIEDDSKKKKKSKKKKMFGTTIKF